MEENKMKYKCTNCKHEQEGYQNLCPICGDYMGKEGIETEKVEEPVKEKEEEAKEEAQHDSEPEKETDSEPEETKKEEPEPEEESTIGKVKDSKKFKSKKHKK